MSGRGPVTGTPGQAAYEAYLKAEVSQFRSPKARETLLAQKAWGTLSGDEQCWWMIAAQAAVTAAAAAHELADEALETLEDNPEPAPAAAPEVAP